MRRPRRDVMRLLLGVMMPASSLLLHTKGEGESLAVSKSLSLLIRGDCGPVHGKSDGFLPVMIDTRYRPEVLQHTDPRFSDVLDYMEWASKDVSHSFRVEGDEVRVA